LADLGASDLVSGLTSLTLYDSRRDEGVDALARAPLSRLHRLYLSESQVGAAVVRALVDSPRLGSLRELLWSFRASAGTGAALAGCAGLSRLRELTLRALTLDDADCAALAASPHVGALTRLSLRENGLTDARLTVLLRAAWLPAVRELRLAWNQITDRGVVALAACPALSRLRVLDLHRNPITGVGGDALAASPYLGRLTRLALPYGTINAKSQERLRERFGNALVLVS
jgi:hypothetical protein